MTEHGKQAPAISAHEFPALRDFFRGYFHQDMIDEYGSPQAAARQFCQDADPSQRAVVAEEWTRFLERMHAQPLSSINRQVAKTLGGAYSFASRDEVENISSILRDTSSPRGS